MARGFGTTWWGEHWLNALAKVDYGNRLPRGATYARTGKVKSLQIDGNALTAKVAGSRPRPYTVKIDVPKFAATQKQALLEAIAKKPMLVAKLLNRELDSSVLPLAESLGLKVFPSTWNDLKMDCSCPDWAVPCKHLAAAIYMLSREIDNDPFLVFKMHDIDLAQALQKLGLPIATNQDAQTIPTLERLITRLTKLRSDQLTHSDEPTSPNNISDSVTEPPYSRVYHRIDFASLDNIVDPIVQLLPEVSPFYAKGRFRDKYDTHFKRCSKAAERLLKLDSITEKLPLSVLADDARLILNHHTMFTVTLDATGEVLVQGTQHELTNLDEVIAALSLLNSDYLADYQPSVAILHKVLYASVHTLANGCVVPQILQTAEGEFAVRWLPAHLHEQTRKIEQQLADMLTFDVLLWQDDSPQTQRETPTKGRSKRQPKNASPNTRQQAITAQAQTLLSLFITRLVKGLSASSNDPFEALFFNGATQAFNNIGEHAIASSIQAWLARYYLSINRYQPVIMVQETKDHQAFTIDISINDTQSSDSVPLPLASLLTGNQHRKTRIEMLQALVLLSSFIDGLDAYIDQGATSAIHMNNEVFAAFLINVIPAIRLLSVQTLLPQSLKTLIRPQVSVSIDKKSDSLQSYFGMADLLEFDWQVALGNRLISPDEFEKLVADASGLLYYKGEYIYVDASDLARLQKQLNAEKTLKAGQLLQTALAENYEGAPITLSDAVRELIQELTRIDDAELPQGLQATLRPYQHRGYSWMLKNSQIGFGSIIADDMGLGKTLQVITLLLKLKEAGALNDTHKALIVVPTGLLTNWQAEINKFAPTLSSHIFHGAKRDIKDFDSDVLLTSYGIVRSEAATFKKIKWQVFAIDEAQNIKNANTAQTKAIKSIKANNCIAMSGTPVENRLSEFWSIMDFANKGYLGTPKQFITDYAKPIQIANDMEKVEKFRRITAPFMLRRMKTDKTIISDLPDKIEINQLATLQDQQAALYEKTVRNALNNIEKVGDGNSERQAMVLQMILALKQICNHPSNYLKNGGLKNGKADPALSGKSQLLLTLLDSIMAAGEKVLIFTQFREMGDLLQAMLTEHFGDTPMFYHGGSSIKERNTMVDNFQNNRADKIFILSLKAAGTGLNLTAASQVIHYDLWWNPAVENQATDRAYRIGQKKNVMVHRLITKDTFEEKIDAMIQDKKRLADLTVATGESWIGQLNNKQLRELFG